jgi:acetate kinase
MPDKKINYNAIGQSIDTTWGRSSTPLNASSSVKMRLLGANMLEVSFKEIINFVAEKEMIVMRRRCEEASLKIIDAHLKDMKKNYKDLTGDSLTTSEVSTSDTLEIIGFNVHNPKRTAYYRRKMIVELS